MIENTTGQATGKVLLTKAKPTVSLSKTAGGSGQMRVNLNWSQGQARTGGLFRRRAEASAVDLDLACLWEMRDGSKGVVQALGNSFGSLTAAPFVLLDGDDRSGQSDGGENLLVNLDRLDQVKRLLVFAYIYEGAPNWAAANGIVTLFPVGAAPIEVRLDEADPQARTCAIAMLTPDGTGLQVSREVRYIQGTQQELDRTYGWGMSWRSGSK